MNFLIEIIETFPDFFRGIHYQILAQGTPITRYACPLEHNDTEVCPDPLCGYIPDKLLELPKYSLYHMSIILLLIIIAMCLSSS